MHGFAAFWLYVFLSYQALGFSFENAFAQALALWLLYMLVTLKRMAARYPLKTRRRRQSGHVPIMTNDVTGKAPRKGSENDLMDVTNLMGFTNPVSPLYLLGDDDDSL